VLHVTCTNTRWLPPLQDPSQLLMQVALTPTSTLLVGHLPG
jgi:hypothetical protein